MSLDSPEVSDTDFLKTIGPMPDAQIPLAAAALRLAAMSMPGIVLQRYFHYLSGLGQRVRQRHHDLVSAGAEDDVQTQLAALKHILVDEDGFIGDAETYDHLDNANLIRVIDRRQGMPITLAILYIHAGQAAGFAIEGVNFPGHFLVRLMNGAQRLIFDPFDQCTVMEAPQMRALIKRVQGDAAELSASYYETASPRDILIRLQNNIKLRQVEMEDYAGALRTVECMRLVDPGEFRLLLDAGVLYAKVGQPQAAIPMLHDYIENLPVGHRNRHDAQMLLAEILRQIN